MGETEPSGQYLRNLNKTDRIEVSKGKTLTLKFTKFDIEESPFCANGCCDHLTITEGEEGTILMEKTCGNERPVDIISHSNIVSLVFITDNIENEVNTGWEVQWMVS